MFRISGTLDSEAKSLTRCQVVSSWEIKFYRTFHVSCDREADRKTLRLASFRFVSVE